MAIHLKPELNAEQLKQDYQIDKRSRLYNVLAPEDARRVSECLASETPFANAFNIDGVNGVLSDDQLRQLSREEQLQLQQKIYAHASQGAGFLYGRYNLTGSDRAQCPTPLRDVTEFLNSDGLLSLIRTITGYQDIIAASAQATRYLPGNFLTRHNDFHPDEGRRVAYVFGFSPYWHPDWGGLLQFYQQSGTPRDAWSPEFNSLTLFDVSHVHAVTFVAPYAAAHRLAVTGWFRSKPL